MFVKGSPVPSAPGRRAFRPPDKVLSGITSPPTFATSPSLSVDANRCRNRRSLPCHDDLPVPQNPPFPPVPVPDGFSCLSLCFLDSSPLPPTNNFVQEVVLSFPFYFLILLIFWSCSPAFVTYMSDPLFLFAHDFIVSFKQSPLPILASPPCDPC